MKNEKYLTPKEAIEVLNSDIVAIAMFQSGKWKWFNYVPTQEQSSWSFENNKCGFLPINIKYDDDWKDSLTVREKPFEITETGLYRTRDGRRAFVSDIPERINKHCFCYGVIEGNESISEWRICGSSGTHMSDIISKWTDE